MINGQLDLLDFQQMLERSQVAHTYKGLDGWEEGWGGGGGSGFR